MTRILLLCALLTAATLAGCAAGPEGQIPIPTSNAAQDDASAPGGGNGSARQQGEQGQGNDGWRGDLRLSVEPKHGIAPANVTIDYDVGDRSAAGGRGQGNQGNGEGQGRSDANGTGNATGASSSSTTAPSNSTGNSTAGNATGNATGNSTGNPTGNSTAGTNGQSASASANLTWTLRVWRMQAGEDPENMTADGNGTGNATGNSTTGGSAGNSTSGNATGNATGNSTSTTTASPSGNATGNSTGGSTGTAGNATGASGNATSGNGTSAGSTGNFTLAINGTLDDLPGHTEHTVHVAGHYKVRFEVTYPNGTSVQRTAVFHVRELQDGEALGNETRSFEGSFLASEPLTCSMGAEEFSWLLNDTFDGDHGLRSARVGHVNVTLTSEGLFDDYEIALLLENGTELARGGSIDLPGPLAAGNYTLLVESCVAAETSFMLTAVADYVYDAAGRGDPAQGKGRGAKA
jgi:hypothetical protein